MHVADEVLPPVATPDYCHLGRHLLSDWFLGFKGCVSPRDIGDDPLAELRRGGNRHLGAADKRCKSKGQHQPWGGGLLTRILDYDNRQSDSRLLQLTGN
jgi:hypothetical protein